jgi:hypothetical protein
MNRSLLRRAFLLITLPKSLLVGLAYLLLPGTCFAQATTFTSQITVPVVETIFNPCTGEQLDVSGNIHFLVSMTVNSNTSFFTLTVNNDEVVATGETTGNTYRDQGVGTFSESSSNFGFPVEFTAENNSELIGTKSTAGRALLEETLHVTINANGTMTAFVDNFSLKCQ